VCACVCDCLLPRASLHLTACFRPRYKCPDVAAFSEATKKAQLALRQAEEELLRSQGKSKTYREPWTPPSLGRSGAALAASSAARSGKKTDLGALLEEAAQGESRVVLEGENLPPSPN